MSSLPLIIGHRGAPLVAPENTLVAFSLALDDGADGIEFDVRLSRDGVPVVIHDPTLKRTGLVDRAITELTAKELQRIDVGSWFDRRPKTTDAVYAGEKLPTLKQVFDLVHDRGILYLEMKCSAEESLGLGSEVVRMIRESSMIERVIVLSFDLSSLSHVKRLNANVRTAALFEPKLSQPSSVLRSAKIIDLAEQCGVDEIALHHSFARPRLIEEARRHGFEVVVWTVNHPKWIARARSLGVKALMTNDSRTLLSHRN